VHAPSHWPHTTNHGLALEMKQRGQRRCPARPAPSLTMNRAQGLWISSRVPGPWTGRPGSGGSRQRDSPMRGYAALDPCSPVPYGTHVCAGRPNMAYGFKARVARKPKQPSCPTVCCAAVLLCCCAAVLLGCKAGGGPWSAHPRSQPDPTICWDQS